MIWVFLSWILKILFIWNKLLRICLIAKFLGKIKMLKLRGEGSLIWLFQDRSLKKNISISICNKFCLISVFFSRNLKSICYVSNQPPQILVNAKFHEKIKLSKLKTKIDLFGYFWPKMSYLPLFGLEFEKNIVIYETSLLNLSCSKVLCKNKNP